MKSAQWPFERIRWVTELLFSVNLIFHALGVASIRLRYPVVAHLLLPGRGLVSLLYQILPVPKVLREGDLNLQYFLGSVIVLSALVFLMFRLASRVSLSLSEVLLRHLAGVASVAAFPLATRYSGGLRLEAPYWLPLEILAAVILTALYQFGFLRKNTVLMLLLLAAHFVLWGWAMGPSWFWPVHPILGFGAAVSWGIYLQHFPAAKGSVLAVPR